MSASDPLQSFVAYARMPIMTMSPEDSAEVFEREYLSTADIETQPTRSLLQSVIAFYRNETATGLVEAEGDMLLFQFGIYDWGSGPFFEIDMTRQFVELERDEDEDVYSQFSLTCFYAPDDRLAAFGCENRWCSDVSELEGFAAWVEAHPVLDALENASRQKTEVSWELV